MRDCPDWEEQYDFYFNKKLGVKDVYIVGSFDNRCSNNNHILADFRAICYIKRLDIAIELVAYLNGGKKPEGSPVYFDSFDTLLKSYYVSQRDNEGKLESEGTWLPGE
jgi:hypothetical protein